MLGQDISQLDETFPKHFVDDQKWFSVALLLFPSPILFIIVSCHGEILAGLQKGTPVQLNYYLKIYEPTIIK